MNERGEDPLAEVFVHALFLSRSNGRGRRPRARPRTVELVGIRDERRRYQVTRNKLPPELELAADDAPGIIDYNNLLDTLRSRTKTSILRVETKREAKPTVYMYDASDFYPRGSLRSETSPPYPITPPSAREQKYGSLLKRLGGAGADSLIGWVRTMRKNFLRGEERIIAHSKKRVPPEDLAPWLTLEVVSGSLQRQLSMGEKIAVVAPKDGTYVLLIDMKNGNIAPLFRIRLEEAFPDYFKKTKPQKAPGQIAEKEQLPFMGEDLVSVGVLTAKDRGWREYRGKTDLFWKAMNDADLDASLELMGNLEEVTETVNSIRRMAKRVGRINVRDMLARFRQLQDDERLQDTFGVIECVKDIEFFQKLGGEGKNQVLMTKERVATGLRTLFAVERAYLNAILHFPRNKTGPEPFDALIDVLWFRFDFRRLKHEWEKREGREKGIVSEFFRNAAIARKRDWASRTHGVSTIKELRRLGIEVDMEQVRAMGSVNKYLDRQGIRAKIKNYRNGILPSELTRLLWGTLKYAQESQYRTRGEVHFFDVGEFGPNEENSADPKWQDLGDEQGRLVLPGEDLASPLSHVLYDSKDKLALRRVLHQVEKERTEYDLGQIEVELEKLGDQPDEFAGIVRSFNEAIAPMAFNLIVDSLRELSELQRIVVLHRLGYPTPENDKYPAIEPWRPVVYLVNCLFGRNTHQYYNTLKEANMEIVGYMNRLESREDDINDDSGAADNKLTFWGQEIALIGPAESEDVVNRMLAEGWIIPGLNHSTGNGGNALLVISPDGSIEFPPLYVMREIQKRMSRV